MAELAEGIDEKLRLYKISATDDRLKLEVNSFFNIFKPSNKHYVVIICGC